NKSGLVGGLGRRVYDRIKPVADRAARRRSRDLCGPRAARPSLDGLGELRRRDRAGRFFRQERDVELGGLRRAADAGDSRGPSAGRRGGRTVGIGPHPGGDQGRVGFRPVVHANPNNNSLIASCALPRVGGGIPRPTIWITDAVGEYPPLRARYCTGVAIENGETEYDSLRIGRDG